MSGAGGAGGAGEDGQGEARRCGNAFDMTIYVFTSKRVDESACATILYAWLGLYSPSHIPEIDRSYIRQNDERSAVRVLYEYAGPEWVVRSETRAGPPVE